jgi:probable rRNA maturation factor
LSTLLFIRNQQRKHALNGRYLDRLIRSLMRDHLGIGKYDLGIYIVRAPRMAEINRAFLQHEGSTDVITFDYTGAKGPPGKTPPPFIHGELFICIDDAIAQAREFHTTWQSELIRYVIHGILHLCGHDDLKPAPRRTMKQAENRLVRQLERTCPANRLGSRAMGKRASSTAS